MRDIPSIYTVVLHALLVGDEKTSCVSKRDLQNDLRTSFNLTKRQALQCMDRAVNARVLDVEDDERYRFGGTR